MRIVLGRHTSRADSTLRIGISVGESLQKIFDEYVRKELEDLRTQIDLLQQVGRDLQKESEALEDLESRFEETSNRLNTMLNVAREGKIKSLSWEGTSKRSPIAFPKPTIVKKTEKPVQDLEIDTLVDGFVILGELEDLRAETERWSTTYVRDIDDLLSVVDERFRQLERRP